MRRALAAIFVFALSLCLRTPSSTEPKAAWQAERDKIVKGAESEGRLVIYDPTGKDQQTLYSDLFQHAYPKIRVYYTPGRLSEIIHRIMAEQRAGIRQVDLVLGGTDLLLEVLKEKGLLQPIRPVLLLPEVLDPSAWFKGKLWFADHEDKYVAMWRAVPYVSACVNTNLVKVNELRSYWDLLDRRWKGRIVCQDLKIGSARNQMYAVYAREDLGSNYLRRLFGETDVVFSRSLPQIGDWLASGKFAIALGGVDCRDLAEKGLPVAMIHLEGLGAVGAGTDPAAFLASAPHPNAARVFLNWILSREGQIAFQKMTKENSLRIDIPKKGVIDPAFILDEKREYLFTGLEMHKEKIREFTRWLESLARR